MSAKWRALQHHHQYTYTAVIFPQSYTENLNNLPLDIASFRFFTELKELISLNSIYAQVNAVKKVATAFGELLGSNGEIVVNQAILRFYLEIFFVENSLPLHRTLLGVLVKIRDYKNVIGSCLRLLCDEYGSLGKGRRFVLSRVALSMMSYPKLGFLLEIVEECSVKFALDATFGLRDVAVEVNNGSRPSPVAMEQCQEALSCLYYLLQRFPAKFAKDSNLGEMIMGAMISVLRSASFSRDSLVAAGVGFCAVLQLCLTLEELGYFIVKSFFRHASIDTDVFVGVEQKLPWKGDLYVEIGNFSVLSRLCLLRGILTSMPRAILGTRYDFSADSIDCLGADKSRRNTVWTILFDGILPELCVYCENPVDSHFNFHVLTVLQICFQQIKTILSANIFNVSEDYDPLPEGMGSRILKIIWNNLDDTLNQTVKQVHLIFDLFLDVRSTLSSPENSDRSKSFLLKTASDLLKLGPRCKGRYVPLASITKRLGAKTVLSMNPDLLFETMYAYIDDDVCCASTSFLKCFLECLRDECWSSDGVESGYMSFREHCLPPIMNGLVSGISKLRSNLNTYALPVLLAVDVDSVFPMLDFISVKQNREDNEVSCTGLSGAKLDLSVDQQVAALVSLLKVSRFLALVEGDIEYEKSSIFQEINMRTENRDLFALLCMKGIKFKVPVKWLVLALTHVDETLRVDAAESLFLNPKTSSLPSHLELGLLKEAVPLNMRCCSTAFQMKWTSLFRKFFSRVRTALEKQFKQGSWKPLTCTESEEEDTNKSRNGVFPDRAKDLFQFMRWFSCFLFFSCYPSAPYERKIMAMELILIMINVWPIVPPSNENSNSAPVSTLYPYGEGFTSPDSTLLLVGSIIDSWDKLRENSFCILLHFPTPLPGISSEERVREVIAWAKKLVCSPRVRESDAGALCLRLIFRKYVLELEWIVGASVNVICFRSHSELLNSATQLPKSKFPVIEYILSLIDWLDVAVTAGENDLSEACRNSFVHGVLLALRYTFEELNWNSDVVISSSSEMRNAIERLLVLVKRITDLALWVVSADAWHLPEDMEDMDGEDALVSDISVETAENNSSSELQTTNSKSVDASAGPSDQVVMVGCWLAMKEVSLLLGTITKKTPLPTCSSSDSSKTEKYILEGCENVSMVASNEILDLRQLESIGNHFLEVLLKMKHNGAIDKTRAGFTALCNRLLCSNDPRLCEMTESWMDQLMERTTAKGQTVDDLLRRSAGIPAGFIALFLSEPEGTPKKLLPRAMRWLLDVANTSLPNPVEPNHQTGGLVEQSVKSNQTPISTKTIEIDGSEKNSKSRHEGVIPTVHAFNVLRASFNDANLGTDTSGFSAEALIMSIRAFSSQYWEVRNSACLAYTALLRRMVGFLNVQKRESARRALTAVEFFHRYPTLHPFLFHELKVATELLGDGTSRKLESNISKVVHPSLFPVLILLARLKPSMISCETEDPLDPFLFMPFIRRCSTQSNLRVRVLASRALLGLISIEKLGTVLLNIASGLPHSRNETSFNSIHGILLQVCSLLDVNCRNLSDISKKEQILGNLIDLLKKCSWIGNPKSCPCSTLNTSFLHVLDHILGIVRTYPITQHIDTIRNLLLESSSECLDSDSFSKSSFHDPTKPELRKQAAGSYFNCVFQANTVLAEQSYQFLQIPSDSLKVCELEKEIDGVTERLMISLSDSSYEVRIATLKWLLRFLKSDGIHGYRIYKWAERNLQPLLVELLAKEVHPRCVCYILRVIFTWNSLQFKNSSSVGAMDCDSVLDLWDRLMALNEVVRHTKAKEALLCCMGICVKRLSVLFKNDESAGKWGRIYGCSSIFVGLIQEYSVASEPVNMRDAAATSMVASGLLGEAPYISSLVIKNPESTSEDTVNLYACRILDLWFTCIKLLEDEDIGIREMLAKDVQKYFSVGETSTQVEKVIEMSFEFLSSLFSQWITYYDYLAKRVLDTSIYVVSQGDLVRRVFDKEIDNHHEEKILISQICCVHLEKIPSELEAAVTFLQKWRLRFYKQFILFANGYLQGGVGVNWVGGPGNHKDVFVSLYANLLGLFATSRTLFNRCDEISEPGLSDILDLEETIRSFLGNPLICNLFLVVVRDHKIKCGDASWNSDVWPGFDPYFLLR